MATIEDFVLRMKVDGQQNVTKLSDGVKVLSKDVADFGARSNAFSGALDGIVSRMGPVGSVVSATAGAFAALGLRAIQIADQLGDLSTATNISASALLSFKQSIVDAGGKADQFESISTKLNQSVQEAAGGNEKLQSSFKQLGVFVTDAGGNIRSTEAILKDLTTRFAEGRVSGEDYSAAVDLMGKNIRNLDLTKLQAVNDPFKDEQIAQLSKYQDVLDKVTASIENRLIEAFGKVTIKFMDMIDAADKAEAALNKSGQSTKSVPLGGFGVVGELASRAASRFGYGYTGSMSAEEQKAYDEAQQARLMSPYKTRAPTPSIEAGGYGGDSPEKIARLAKEKEAAAEKAKRLAEALAKETTQINNSVSAYEISIKKSKEKYDLDTANIGQSKDAADVANMRFDAEYTYLSETNKLQQKYNELKTRAAAGDENAKKLLPAVKDAIEQVTDAYQEQFQVIDELVAARSKATEQEQLHLFNIKTQIDLESKLNDIRDLSAKMGMTSIEKKYYDIATAARNAATAAIQAEEARRGSPLSDAEKEQYYANAKKGVGELQKAEQEYYEKSRDWNTGWQESMNDYVELATNAARQAEIAFKTATQGMEDSIVNFAKTGKFEWRSFVNDMLTTLLRSQLQQTMASVFSYTKGNGGVVNSISKLLGFAGGGLIPNDGPVIVGEQGPEILSGAGGRTVTPNYALSGMGGGSVTYNISAVDAPSFQAMIARDPSFIHAVAMAGARTTPKR